MNFSTFAAELRLNAQTLMTTHRALFLTSADPELLWKKYLASFPEGTNPEFRKRTEHDCTCCRHFIQRYGMLVAIHPTTFALVSIWDGTFSNPAYAQVAQSLSALVKASPIADVMVESVDLLGVKESLSRKPGQDVEKWSHLHIILPKSHQHSLRGTTADTVRGEYRTKKQCLERAFDEITPSSVSEVRELIQQGTLYRGESWAAPLETFQTLQTKYLALSNSNNQRENFCWAGCSNAGTITQIRNTSIGTLLVDLSSGMEMDAAVRRYEAVTAPSNYQRPKAIVTKATLTAASKTLEELGLADSLPHRFAHLEDITVNNVLFADRNVRTKMKGDAISQLQDMAATSAPAKKMSRLESMPWQKFVTDVLPAAESVEVLFAHKHQSNLVSLIAPVNPGAKRVFKWDNGFSWAYRGNVADSMKERVKAAGGKVDGVLRFSIQWNEQGENRDDLDAHCIMGTRHIYFGSKLDVYSRGELDVDIIHPDQDAAVENITWPSLSSMPDGTYSFYVHCYSHRGGKNGFRAEIEFDGQIHSFDYNQTMHGGQQINVATVTKRGNAFAIAPLLKMGEGVAPGREIWGISTNTFHPVHAVMFSPNYWDGQDGIGHRHLIFTLKGCVSDETPNGFYNEFLRNELAKHRRVFEVLGGKMAVEADSNQLSGLGFSTTKRDEVTVRVKGKTERVFNVAF